MHLPRRLTLPVVLLLCAHLACALVERPVARAGASRTVPRSSPVVLDGSRSSDPEGHRLTFAWSFVSIPPGSGAALSEPSSMRTTFTPDVKGEYGAQLVVSNGIRESLPETVTLTVENAPLRADAGADFAAVVGTAVSLAGQGLGGEGDSHTFAWTLTQRPTDSAAALSGADTPTPSFVPDVEGEYRFSLVVGDGVATSFADTLTVQAHPPIHLLGHRVIDAEYSKALDRLVMVGSRPNALYVYDPATGSETSVALPMEPSSVSVGPDGLFAAVGYDSFISYVDLTTPRLLKTLPVGTDVLDLVLAGDGYVYAFPRMDQWVQIHSVSLSTGRERLSGSIYAGTRARLQPQGTALYGVTAGLDAELERYDVASGTVQASYSGPFPHGYSICGGGLWFSEDGARLFTGCGSVVRASSLRSEDMTYVGSLPGTGFIQSLSHSAGANRVAWIRTRGYYEPSSLVDTQVHLALSDSLEFDRSVPLPSFVKEGKAFVGRGRFVFFNAAGDRMMVILQADGGTAMLDDYGIFTD